MNHELCPECSGILYIDEKRGEIACGKCGLILKEKELDFSHHERITFTKEDKLKKDRTGSPISPLLSEIGLKTVISKKYIFNQDLKRILEKDSYMSWSIQNLLIANKELKRLCFNLNLPSHIKYNALKLYKEAFKKKLIKGKSIKGMVAACVYFTCKVIGVPRTFNEICSESPDNSKLLRKCYNVLINSLDLKACSINPIYHIPRFISKLNLDFETEKLSIKLLQTYLKGESIDGKNPLGFCAGAIYLASKLKNLKINQKIIAGVVGVTVTTLRSRFENIRTVLI